MNKILKKKIAVPLMLMLWLVVFPFCHKDNIVDVPGTGTVYPNIDSFPSWSPDDSKIIYNHYGITKIGQDGTYSINWDSSGLWMMNVDGSDAHLLLNGYDIYSAWSTEGDWIAYHQGGQIYKIPISSNLVDEAGVEQLTSPGENYFPAWSPDGEQIAYDCISGQQGIWIMDTTGSNRKNVAEGRYPDWSINGTHIIYIGLYGEIFCVNILDTSDMTRLTFLNQIDIYATDNRYPRYSPDGMQVVFESNANIWVMDVDGSNLKQLTTNSGRSPSWSPDGTRIAYIGFTDPSEYDPGGNGTVWIMNADRSDKKQLTFGPSS